MVGRFVGVGREVGLPFALDVADGVDVDTEVDVGRAVDAEVGVPNAGPEGCWVDESPMTATWAEPRAAELVGVGSGFCAAMVTREGAAGDGRNGDWIVGPPSRVLSSTIT